MGRAGVDIGGTFTDVISYDPGPKTISVGKVSSTPADPSEGLMDGLDAIDLDPGAIDSLFHGTTVATNTVLEGTGGRCGLLTTAGFEGTLELGWRDRPHLWGLSGEYDPLIHREHVIGIEERMAADGTELTELPESAVRAAGEQLLAQDVEAVVVSFLHSYINLEHEARAVEILEELWPNPYVVGSSDLLPEFREFERTSTAAITAYTQPVIASYLGRLEEHLAAAGFDVDVLSCSRMGVLLPRRWRRSAR